jgi:hypothetical protein
MVYGYAFDLSNRFTLRNCCHAQPSQQKIRRFDLRLVSKAIETEASWAARFRLVNVNLDSLCLSSSSNSFITIDKDRYVIFIVVDLNRMRQMGCGNTSMLLRLIEISVGNLLSTLRSAAVHSRISECSQYLERYTYNTLMSEYDC